MIFFLTPSRYGLRVALLSAMALISACETIPEALPPGVPAEKAWQQRVKALSGLESWACNEAVRLTY